MAKKKLDDIRLDDLDLNEFDDFDPIEPKDNRKPVEKAAKGAWDGLKSTATSRQFIRNLVKTSLPQGYGDAFDLGDKINSEAKNLYNSTVRELKPELMNLQRSAKKLTPTMKKYLPKSVGDRLEKLLGKSDDSQRRRYDPDGEELRSALGEVFAAQDKASSQDRAQEAAESAIKRKIDEKRAMNAQQIAIANLRANQRMADYQDSIGSKFQRKSLELDFRKLFLLRDLVDEQKRSNVELLTETKAIRHNSALPDALKVRNSELYHHDLKRHLFGEIRQGVGDYFSSFGFNLRKNISSKLKDGTSRFKDALSAASMGLDQADIGGDSFGGPGAAEIGGNLAGTGLAGWLGNKAGRGIRKLTGRNKGVQNLGNRLNYGVTTIPDRINEWAKSPTERFGFLGGLEDLLKSVVPTFNGNQDSVKNNTLEDGYLPAQYDNQSHRTLNEIIPDYLSRLLHSVDLLHTPDKSDADRLIWSQDRARMVTVGQARKDVGSRIVRKSDKEGLDYYLSRVMDEIGAKEGLSDKAQKELKSKLLKDVTSGKSFDPGRYIRDGEFFGEHGRELQEFFEKQFNLDMFGDENEDLSGTQFSPTGNRVLDALGGKLDGLRKRTVAGNSDALSRRSNANSLFRAARNAVPDTNARINQYANTGMRDILRDIGVLRDPVYGESLSDEVNRNYLEERFRDYQENGDKQGVPYPNRDSVHRPRSTGGDAGGLRPDGRYSSFTSRPGQVFDPREYFERLETTLKEGFGSLKDSREDAQPTSWWDEMKDTLENGRVSQNVQAILEQLTEGLRVFSTNVDDGSVPSGGGTRTRKPGKFRRLLNFTGRRAKNLWDVQKWWAKRTVGAAKLGFRGVKGILGIPGKVTNWFISDIFVNGEKDPVMRAEDIRKGKFIDVATKKVIRRIGDITGEVINTDGNIVLGEEEYRRGLTNNTGKKILGGIGRLIGGAAKIVFKSQLMWMKALGRLTKAPLNAAKWLKGKIDNYVSDIYVGDEKKPRLLAKDIKAGVYIDENTRKTIVKLKDITGPVRNQAGDIVLTQEDYAKGLKTLGGRVISKAKSLAALPFKAVGNVAKWGWGKLKAGASAVGGLLSGGLRGLANKLGAGDKSTKGGATSDRAVYILNSIYTLLDARLPGDSFGPLDIGKFKGGRTFRDMMKARRAKNKKGGDPNRDGGWRERLAEKAAKKKAGTTEKGGKEDDSDKGWLMKIFGAVVAVGGIIKKVIGSGLSALGKLLMGRRAAGTLGDLADIAGSGRRKGGLIRGAWNLAKRWGGGALRLGARALPFLGEATMAVGGFVGRAALGALSVAAGIVSAPVALAVGAVAAVGTAAYYGYKWWKGRLDLMQKLRLAQYGIDLDDSDQCKKVLEFEEMVAKDVGFNKDGPTIRGNKIKDYIGFWVQKEDANNSRQYFEKWFANRFKPVFLTHAALVNQYAAGKGVPEESDAVPDGRKPELARKSRFNNDQARNPYFQPETPFVEGKPIIGVKIIDGIIKEIESEYADAEKDLKKKGDDKTTTGDQKPADGGKVVDLDKGDKASTLKKGDVIHVNGKDMHATGNQAMDRKIIEAMRRGSTQVSPIKGDVGSTAAVAASLIVAEDPLTQIRYKAYGIVSPGKKEADLLGRMEIEVANYIKISSGRPAEVLVDPDEIGRKWSTFFGVSAATDGALYDEWVYWFKFRFIPVLTAFVKAVKEVNPTGDVWTASRALKASDKIIIAQRMITAKVEISRNTVMSIWDVKARFYLGHPLATDSGITSVDLKALEAKMGGMESKSTEVRRTLAASGDTKQTEDKSEDSSWWGSVKKFFKGNKMETAPSMKGWRNTSKDPDVLTQAGTLATGQKLPGLTGGKPVEHPGHGTGGDINQIPMPEGSGWDGTKNTILAAAKMAGVDPGLMATMASIESSFKPNAKASTSSATGLYQFTRKTWIAMLNKYGKKYGINPDTPPNDPRANALMAAEYIKENIGALKRVIRRPVTDTDVYAAHFLGAGGATNLLGSNPNASAPSVDPDAAKANTAIFYQNGRPRTVKEVYDVLNQKVSAHSDKYAAEARSEAKTMSTSPGSTGQGQSGDTGSSGSFQTVARPPRVQPDDPNGSTDTDTRSAADMLRNANMDVGKTTKIRNSAISARDYRYARDENGTLLSPKEIAEAAARRNQVRTSESTNKTIGSIDATLIESLRVHTSSNELLAKILDQLANQSGNTDGGKGNQDAQTSGGVDSSRRQGMLPNRVMNVMHREI